PIRKVVFAYGVNTDNHANLGDLKTVTLKDGSGNTLDTEYFRYWKTTSGTGYADGLEASFGPDSYARLVAAQGSSVDGLSAHRLSCRSAKGLRPSRGATLRSRRRLSPLRGSGPGPRPQGPPDRRLTGATASRSVDSTLVPAREPQFHGLVV